MTGAAPGRVQTTWAGVIAVVSGVGVLAASFGAFYRYRTGETLRRLCALGGGTACPDLTITRNAWRGVFGWMGVLLAVVGVGLVVMSTSGGRLRIRAASAAVAAFVAAVVVQVLALAVVPRLPEAAQAARDVRATYGDIVVDGHGWAYWLSAGCTALGLVAAVVHVAIIGRVARDWSSDAAGKL